MRQCRTVLPLLRRTPLALVALLLVLLDFPACATTSASKSSTQVPTAKTEPTRTAADGAAGLEPCPEATATNAAGLDHCETIIIGDIDRAAVWQVVDESAGAILSCWGGKKEGVTELRFALGGDGGVTKVWGFKSTLDEEAEACVFAAISRLRFPPPSGGGSPRVGLRFSPRH